MTTPIDYSQWDPVARRKMELCDAIEASNEALAKGLTETWKRRVAAIEHEMTRRAMGLGCADES